MYKENKKRGLVYKTRERHKKKSKGSNMNKVSPYSCNKYKNDDFELGPQS